MAPYSFPFGPMFSLDQIRDAHARVKTGADFPTYVRDLVDLGIESYDVSVADGHARYAGADGFFLLSPARYEPLAVAGRPDARRFRERLSVHQNGGSDYAAFCRDAADAGVEKWTVDTRARTCTYYDATGNALLAEDIPA